jgi:hypothetical protein
MNSQSPGYREEKQLKALTDYSEEAIPERDPAYRTTDGTLHEEQTVDEMSADMRLALIQSLVQLGMSPSRAAMVASL